MKNNFKYENPDGVVTEYRFVDRKFVGLFNDGVKKSNNPLPIGTILTPQLDKNLGVAGFEE